MTLENLRIGPGRVVEGHFKWLNESLSLVPKHLVESSDGKAVNYVRNILESIKNSDDQDSQFRRVTDLCWKLNTAAQYTFVGDYDGALKCIKMASDELEYHMKRPETDLSESHANAYKYVIEACALTVASELMNKYGLSSLDIGIEEQFEKLDKRWNDLMEGKKFQAVVAFLKACLVSSMRLPDAIVLSQLKQAVALEPDFHGWYRYLYRKCRQMRRTSGNRFSMTPSQEEMEACQKAYKLRPDVGDNIANMANMWEELLKSSKKTMTDKEISDDLQKLVTLLRNSMVTCNDPWTKVRLAEIYGYGNYQLDASQGEQLFQECIEQWPSNSMVWHKAGKFYHLGGNPHGGGSFVDTEKACCYYRQALQISPCNFPCLMDYLKLLREPLNDLGKIVQVIDDYIPHVKREDEFQKVLVIKGLVLWMDNMNEKGRLLACASWLEVIDRYPNSANEVANAIRRRRMEVVGLVDVNVDEVIMLLQKQSQKGPSGHVLIKAMQNNVLRRVRVPKIAETAEYDTGKEKASAQNDLLQANKECIQETLKPEPVLNVQSVNDSPKTVHVYLPRGRGRGQARRNRGVRGVQCTPQKTAVPHTKFRKFTSFSYDFINNYIHMNQTIKEVRNAYLT